MLLVIIVVDCDVFDAAKPIAGSPPSTKDMLGLPPLRDLLPSRVITVSSKFNIRASDRQAHALLKRHYHQALAFRI